MDCFAFWQGMRYYPVCEVESSLRAWRELGWAKLSWGSLFRWLRYQLIRYLGNPGPGLIAILGCAPM